MRVNKDDEEFNGDPAGKDLQGSLFNLSYSPARYMHPQSPATRAWLERTGRKEHFQLSRCKDRPGCMSSRCVDATGSVSGRLASSEEEHASKFLDLPQRESFRDCSGLRSSDCSMVIHS
jgi:hypothetical protein